MAILILPDVLFASCTPLWSIRHPHRLLVVIIIIFRFHTNTTTKFSLFRINALPALLYGSKTRETTASVTQKLQTFLNICLWIVIGLLWPDPISREGLCRCTAKMLIHVLIRRRQWQWGSHTLRQGNGSFRHSLKSTIPVETHFSEPIVIAHMATI